MPLEQKEKIIRTIIEREKLRPLDRFTRLLKDPVRAFPYYILAAIGHIKPFRITFKTLWCDKMTGYLPEANTFYYYGNCEANLTTFLLRYLKNDMTFIDVGAHIGFYSLLCGHLVNKVYSFEPTPWTYELLKDNTKKFINITTTNAGASDIDGEFSFSDYGPGYGAYNSASAEGTILRFKPQHITTKTVQLDSFFEKNLIHPDFIKLDAEGFEHKILAGLTKTLRNDRPLITLEMAGDEKWAENCKKSSDILFTAIYESYEMTVDGFLVKCSVKPPYTYTNILFIPIEKIDLVSNLIK